eukprot:tig00021238_g19558.t1
MDLGRTHSGPPGSAAHYMYRAEPLESHTESGLSGAVANLTITHEDGASGMLELGSSGKSRKKDKSSKSSKHSHSLSWSSFGFGGGSSSGSNGASSAGNASGEPYAPQPKRKHNRTGSFFSFLLGGSSSDKKERERALRSGAATPPPGGDESSYPSAIPSRSPSMSPSMSPPPNWNGNATGSRPSTPAASGPPPVLKELIVPGELLDEFERLASENTRRNVETCGILGAVEEGSSLRVVAVLVPQQTGTADNCETFGEESLMATQLEHNLLSAGWIHTHPSQSLFLSSVDLHTQFGYQSLLPEAAAIVIAPSDSPSVGCFRLTWPDGLRVIGGCDRRGFHGHVSQTPLYEKCAHVRVVREPGAPPMPFRIFDLRGGPASPPSPGGRHAHGHGHGHSHGPEQPTPLAPAPNPFVHPPVGHGGPGAPAPGPSHGGAYGHAGPPPPQYGHAGPPPPHYGQQQQQQQQQHGQYSDHHSQQHSDHYQQQQAQERYGYSHQQPPGPYGYGQQASAPSSPHRYGPPQGHYGADSNHYGGPRGEGHGPGSWQPPPPSGYGHR